MKHRFLVVILMLSLCVVFGGIRSDCITKQFKIESDAFDNGAEIPVRFTCDGKDLSPPLTWTDPPEDTRSFVLICDDPDAPVGTWTHWILVNIPPETRRLPLGLGKTEPMPKGIISGRNDFGHTGYGGPCPPPGKAHRYFFRLYALDDVLKCRTGVSRKEVEKAMQGHVLATCVRMGRYRRHPR